MVGSTFQYDENNQRLNHSSDLAGEYAPFPFNLTEIKNPERKTGIPVGLGNLEKLRRHFPVRKKSRNFECTGKVRQNKAKYSKTQGM